MSTAHAPCVMDRIEYQVLVRLVDSEALTNLDIASSQLSRYIQCRPACMNLVGVTLASTLLNNATVHIYTYNVQFMRHNTIDWPATHTVWYSSIQNSIANSFVMN